MESDQNKRLQETMHALRQPLNAMRLTLGNLLFRIAADGEQLDLARTAAKLEIMDLQIQRMSALIDSLQVTSKAKDD